ncbi:hypothetical protein JCM5353_003386 [Sporobolomyces roseus]
MVTITRANAEDCLQLADIQFDAFSPLIVHQRVFGNVTKENHSKHLAEQMRKSIEKAGSELYKAVIQDDRGQEKMVGMAWYDRPKRKGQEEDEKKEDEIKTEEDKRAAMKEKFPEGSDFDLAISYFGRIDSDVLHRDVDEPFYHLHLLAIDPSIQRTGAGTVLLKWVLEQADKEGVACYLESSDIGVGLYRRYGFEEFTEPIVAGKDAEMIIWPMRRPPLAQSRTTDSGHDK